MVSGNARCYPQGMVVLMLGCAGGTDSDSTFHRDSDTPPDSGSDTGPIVGDLGEPLARTDVVIIGGGASGLTAAVEAAEVGAAVLIIERESGLGGAGVHAGNCFGAGTTWQAAAGVVDSPEAALAEWADFTNGGDPSHPWVENFVYGSAETLEWLAGYGAGFSQVTTDPGAGETARIHPLSMPGDHPVSTLAELLVEDAWLNTTAVSLIERDGAVIGVEVEEEDGSIGWVEAGAVVVATGGFARNDDRVYEAIPALIEFPRHAESWPGMDGNGLDLIEAVGGDMANLENIALYAHGVTDAYLGAPEVMILVGLADVVVVGEDAERVLDEDDLRAVWGGRKALTAGQLYAVFDSTLWDTRPLTGLGYNYDDITESFITGADYQQLVDVPSSGDLVSLGQQVSLDGATLAQTVADYNAMALAGEDTDFGKDMAGKLQLMNPPYYAVPLAMGTGKSFGGAALAEDGAVLGVDGVAIPGLFAAGEVAGVLGGAHLGQGISGSITAVIYSGRVAGAGAGAYALR
jgi:fumarate reductase flavoprotein subunit